MLLIPDPNTAVIDPFRQHPTLNINCFVQDPVTGESYTRDPRYVAKKAEDYLKGTGIADTAYFGPEAEFYIFDDVRFDQNQYSGYYFVDSVEGVWNSGARRATAAEPRLQAALQGGLLPRPADGPLPGPAVGDGARRSSCVGIEIEVQHHEVGTAGQAEIDMRFDTLLTHGRQADALQVRGQERRVGSRQVGHVHAEADLPGQRLGHALHQSLWKGGEPLFFDEKGYAGLSDIARWYIGGLLHARAGDPRVLDPDDELVQAAGAGLRGAGQPRVLAAQPLGVVRIPLVLEEPEGQAPRVPLPRPVVQPVPRLLGDDCMAGLDGIQNRIEPPTPVDKDLYDLPPEELAQVPQVPGSLDEALDALEADHDFLLAGGVFTPDVIETWIDYKRDERDRRDPAPPAPVGVLPVLRHLATTSRPGRP